MCVLCVCESWYIGVGVCVMHLCVFECTTCVCVCVLVPASLCVCMRCMLMCVSFYANMYEVICVREGSVSMC